MHFPLSPFSSRRKPVPVFYREVGDEALIPIIMQILSICVKQRFLDRILSGKKKFITRKIKPMTWKKYLIVDENEKSIELINYDALRLSFGIGANVNVLLVKIIDQRLVLVVEKDELPAFYEFKGHQIQMLEVDYFLGEILEKTIV